MAAVSTGERTTHHLALRIDRECQTGAVIQVTEILGFSLAPDLVKRLVFSSNGGNRSGPGVDLHEPIAPGLELPIVAPPTDRGMCPSPPSVDLRGKGEVVCQEHLSFDGSEESLRGTGEPTYNRQGRCRSLMRLGCVQSLTLGDINVLHWPIRP